MSERKASLFVCRTGIRSTIEGQIRLVGRTDESKLSVKFPSLPGTERGECIMEYLKKNSYIENKLSYKAHNFLCVFAYAFYSFKKKKKNCYNYVRFLMIFAFNNQSVLIISEQTLCYGSSFQ